MTKDEALKLALEALQHEADTGNDDAYKLERDAIKEALAQPEPWEKFCDSNCVWTDHYPDCKLAEQEPVAWLKVVETHGGWGKFVEAKPNDKDAKPVYTTPPPVAEPHKRKPLSDEKINEFFQGMEPNNGFWLSFARAIEAAHGIKENT
jgi:hypothetical protein